MMRKRFWLYQFELPISVDRQIRWYSVSINVYLYVWKTRNPRNHPSKCPYSGWRNTAQDVAQSTGSISRRKSASESICNHPRPPYPTSCYLSSWCSPNHPPHFLFHVCFPVSSFSSEGSVLSRRTFSAINSIIHSTRRGFWKASRSLASRFGAISFPFYHAMQLWVAKRGILLPSVKLLYRGQYWLRY